MRNLVAFFAVLLSVYGTATAGGHDLLLVLQQKQQRAAVQTESESSVNGVANTRVRVPSAPLTALALPTVSTFVTAPAATVAIARSVLVARPQVLFPGVRARIAARQQARALKNAVLANSAVVAVAPQRADVLSRSPSCSD